MKFGTSETVKTSNFSFSHVGLEKLGGQTYTIVDITIDVSASITPYKSNLEDMVFKIIESCKKCPNAENLLIRVTHFSAKVQEFHGYTLLSEIKESDYTGSIKPRGMTSLIDAIASGAESGWTFGRTLYDKDYDVNHIQFILTDGGENCSTLNYSDLPPRIQKLKNQEYLESSLTIVLHMGDPCIEDLKKLNCIDDFINYGDLTVESLNKVAGYVSESISSQSQHLGSGGPSQLLNF